MTKLEQKLAELEYKYYILDCYYKKKFNDYIYIIIDIVDDKVNELNCGIEYNQPLTIELLKMTYKSRQQAFNEMQRDLEILKGIDKPTPKNDIGNELWEKDVKHMQELGEWERKQWNH